MVGNLIDSEGTGVEETSHGIDMNAVVTTMLQEVIDVVNDVVSAWIKELFKKFVA
jgi:hypothetical protein